jgi:serine/threonine protein kinase
MDPKAHNLSKYQLVECIAHGGMGEVWKAFDTQLKRYVAIKLLHPGMQRDPDFITRFEQEARLIASLRHPNIIKIHDFKIEHRHGSHSPASPLCYMVMDYVPGQTLADYINNTSRRGAFPPATDIVYIFTVVGLALDYAHQSGMIHRDIKPANILLDKRTSTTRAMGEPILTDFGIARQRGITSGTMVGSVIGTPKYIAPEQARGQYDDPRSDLYSLGIILYEIMTGETPFNADTPLAAVMQHLHEKPRPPEIINPHISQSLSQVILKSIAKDPDERFPTAATLALALAQAFHVPAPQDLGGPSGVPFGGSSADATVTLNKSIQRYIEGNCGRDQSGHYISGNELLQGNCGRDQSGPYISGNELLQGNCGRDQSGPYISGNELLQRNCGRNQSGPHISGNELPQTYPPSDKIPTRLIASIGHGIQSKHKRQWIIGLTILLVLVLLGSGLIARMILLPSSASGPAGETVIGHVSFIQHGSSQNYNAVRIDITHVPELPPGMAYYAWIELVNGEDSENTVPPHWELAVSNQAIHTPPLTFAGFANLYVPPSLFLITKEQTAIAPIVPDPNSAARLYYARVTSAKIDLKPCPTSQTDNACLS